MKVVEINAHGWDGVPVLYRVICDDVDLVIPEGGAGLTIFEFTDTTYVEFSEQGSTPVRRGKLETLGFRGLLSFEVVDVSAEEATANNAS